MLTVFIQSVFGITAWGQSNDLLSKDLHWTPELLQKIPCQDELQTGFEFQDNKAKTFYICLEKSTHIPLGIDRLFFKQLEKRKAKSFSKITVQPTQIKLIQFFDLLSQTEAEYVRIYGKDYLDQYLPKRITTVDKNGNVVNSRLSKSSEDEDNDGDSDTDSDTDSDSDTDTTKKPNSNSDATSESATKTEVAPPAEQTFEDYESELNKSDFPKNTYCLYKSIKKNLKLDIPLEAFIFDPYEYIAPQRTYQIGDNYEQRIKEVPKIKHNFYGINFFDFPKLATEVVDLGLLHFNLTMQMFIPPPNGDLLPFGHIKIIRPKLANEFIPASNVLSFYTQTKNKYETPAIVLEKSATVVFEGSPRDYQFAVDYQIQPFDFLIRKVLKDKNHCLDDEKSNIKSFRKILGFGRSRPRR